LSGCHDFVSELRLIRTPGIGPIAYRQLLARFGGAAAALDAIPDLARRGGGKPPDLFPERLAHREIAAVERLRGSYMLLGRDPYPEVLAELQGAPPLITFLGDPALLRRPMVALVGARNASAAACRFARQLAFDLGQEGVTIVSGLARGVDSAAHDGSIETGTIAVIAGGLDVAYPPENEARQRAIAERGLLIAEMPPGTEPHARHFPYRNRIIAGLASGTVVIEAALRSGSLITARLAADAGRDVMAVPGSPLDARAQGCNQLIRDGAILIQSAADVLDMLRPIDGRVASPRSDYAGMPGLPADAADEVRAAVEGLLGPSPVPVDEIVRLSGAGAGAVQLVLLELDLTGRLDRHAGGMISLR
jgi:DNA processing protein